MAIGDLMEGYQDQQDAKRYRWLRDKADANRAHPFIAIYAGSFTQWSGESADEKIDKAMAAFEPEGQPK